VRGSAPEQRLVKGDTKKAWTVVTCDAAKFAHVVGGGVMVGGQKGQKEGVYLAWGHAANEIVYKKIHEPFSFLLNGGRGDPHLVNLGSDVGRLGLSVGVVGGHVKTDLVSHDGDHGGGGEKPRRCQRGKQVD
jgi:hypothetical protein